MLRKQYLNMVIAPTKGIIKDFRANKKAIFFVCGVLICLILLSSLIISICENWTFLHACYFTIINTTTVGFGDVTPLSHIGKIIAGVNALIGLLAFGILVAVITLAFQPSELSAAGSIVSDQSTPDTKAPSDDIKHSNTIVSGLRHLADSIESLSSIENKKDIVAENNSHIRIMSHTHDKNDIHLHIDIYIDK